MVRIVARKCSSLCRLIGLLIRSNLPGLAVKGAVSQRSPIRMEHEPILNLRSLRIEVASLMKDKSNLSSLKTSICVLSYSRIH